MKNNWICTDPDCYQYIRNEKSEYEMIQIIDISPICIKNKDNNYIVVNMKINLNDYEKDEIEKYTQFYYPETENLPDYIIAECILEQKIFCENYQIFSSKYFRECQKFIEEFIKREDL